MNRNPEVEAWLAGYDNPMKSIVMAVREVILSADERVAATWTPPAPTAFAAIRERATTAGPDASLIRPPDPR